MELTPLTPAIGAEITGVDLARLDQDALRDIGTAFLEHHVLVFRDQDLSRDQHKAIGRHFGELHVHPSKRHLDRRGDPEIFTVKTDGASRRNNGGRWHADVTCESIPPLGSLLLLTEAPPSGGDTLFANMHLAFETLSAPIRELLEGLTAHHDGLQDLRWYGFEPKAGQTYPSTTHPVVVDHPETGRPLLFVNEAFTSRIDGLTDAESRGLLDLLFGHIANNPAIQCRVSWEPGTLTMWDNRCTQHYAVWDYAPQVRRGERVTICGTARPAGRRGEPGNDVPDCRP
ncbi:MAG: TauD/TfdA family dioxygenase [Actinomycetota bacterium]